MEEIERARAIVEQTIRSLGIDPASASAKSAPGSYSWAFQRGSAAIVVNLTRRHEDHQAYLRVISPVLLLPAPDARPALFVRLLELNACGLANCAFGLVADRVVVVSERPVEGLDPSECEQIVRHLAAVADAYDDKLVAEFGGRRCADPKPAG